MQLIHCTGKLRKEMGLKKADLCEVVPIFSYLGPWHANLMYIDRRKCGDLEAIFKVISVAVTPGRPHGLKYTLMLLNAKGERVVCFDNAHALSQGSGPGKKKLKTVRP